MPKYSPIIMYLFSVIMFTTCIALVAFPLLDSSYGLALTTAAFLLSSRVFSPVTKNKIK